MEQAFLDSFPEANEPLPITDEEYEGCRSAITSNIEQGLSDPLLKLSDDTEEQLLRQTELMNDARDAIVISDVARGITYWNRGAEHLYGWTADEAAGRDIDLTITASFPDDLRLAGERPHQAILVGALRSRALVAQGSAEDHGGDPAASYLAEAVKMLYYRIKY